MYVLLDNRLMGILLATVAAQLHGTSGDGGRGSVYIGYAGQFELEVRFSFIDRLFRHNFAIISMPGLCGVPGCSNRGGHAFTANIS